MELGDGIIQQFQALQHVWFVSLFAHALWLFRWLTLIEVALCGIYWIADSRGFEAIVGGLGIKLLWIGFMYAVLLNANTWIPAIQNGLMEIGAEAAQVPTLSPGEVWLMGLGLGLKMLWSYVTFGSLANPAGLASGIFCSFAVFISFAVIAIQMGVTLVKAYILSGAGVLLLGLAPLRVTASISERYLNVSIGIGLQLLVLYLVIGAGQTLAPHWADQINDSTAWDYKVPWTVAYAAVLYATVAMSIPKLAGSLASGSVSMGFGDVMAAAFMASRVTAMARNALNSGGGRSPSGATPISSAAQVSVGSGSGNISQGAVPKFNSMPAR